MIQFFAPDITSTFTLPEGESHHCVKVLRSQPGDEIEVIDGKGYRHRCLLIEAHAKHAVVEIVESIALPLSWRYNLTVGVAPTKHLDRMEWLTEKLVEVGVNRIIPLLGDRSERKELKVERIEKIAVSAMKQSLKAVMPKIDEMTSIGKVIEQTASPQRYICYCDDSVERHELCKMLSPGLDTTILIGPEGDFSPREVQLALQHNFTPVTLGDNRLRTETAALYAASTVHIVNRLLDK